MELRSCPIFLLFSRVFYRTLAVGRNTYQTPNIIIIIIFCRSSTMTGDSRTILWDPLLLISLLLILTGKRFFFKIICLFITSLHIIKWIFFSLFLWRNALSRYDEVDLTLADPGKQDYMGRLTVGLKLVPKTQEEKDLVSRDFAWASDYICLPKFNLPSCIAQT